MKAKLMKAKEVRRFKVPRFNEEDVAIYEMEVGRIEVWRVYRRRSYIDFICKHGSVFSLTKRYDDLVSVCALINEDGSADCVDAERCPLLHGIEFPSHDDPGWEIRSRGAIIDRYYGYGEEYLSFQDYVDICDWFLIVTHNWERRNEALWSVGISLSEDEMVTEAVVDAIYGVGNYFRKKLEIEFAEDLEGVGWVCIYAPKDAWRS